MSMNVCPGCGRLKDRNAPLCRRCKPKLHRMSAAEQTRMWRARHRSRCGCGKSIQYRSRLCKSCAHRRQRQRVVLERLGFAWLLDVPLNSREAEYVELLSLKMRGK